MQTVPAGKKEFRQESQSQGPEEIKPILRLKRKLPAPLARGVLF
jgi:hypothetical protein